MEKNQKYKTGVVVGRFQSDKLTEGHVHVINEARRLSDKIVIVIGDSPLNYTDKNPLPSIIRFTMLREAYPEADVLRIEDHPSDEIWSQKLDDLLHNYENVTLYGSRDSFFPFYHGKFSYYKVGEVPHVSATSERKKIARNYRNSNDFRAGIIHAIENRFPTAYHTVDIALVKWRAGGGNDHHLFLGKKPGGVSWVFPGGFVDPTDVSMEAAASRELGEEITGINTHGTPKYICSHKINDFRYRGTKDGIITSFFLSYFMSGNPKAGDDLEEVQEFSIKDFNMNLLSEHHHVLFNSLKHHLEGLNPMGNDANTI